VAHVGHCLNAEQIVSHGYRADRLRVLHPPAGRAAGGQVTFPVL
jgi:hypothetical protein